MKLKCALNKRERERLLIIKWERGVSIQLPFMGFVGMGLSYDLT
jgi:hypothetical protein